MTKRTQKSEKGWTAYIPPHRRREHQAAHRDAPEKLPPVLDHPQVAANTPELITEQPQLDTLINELRTAGRFAYDTEFIGEQSYYTRFCVIQVATETKVTLIDALAPALDLVPFWQLIGDAEVQKLVHAGRQDLEPVVRFCNDQPRNIFDTQIAAGFAGLGHPKSLESLIETLTDATLGQGAKFSQWDHRPLTPTQLAYAANDVRYLHLLTDLLTEQVEQHGHTAWMQAELEVFGEPSQYIVDPMTQRIKAPGIRDLSRRQLAVLNSLILWRGEAAKEQDIPLRHMVSDPVLVELAIQSESLDSADALHQVKGLPRPVKEHYTDAILQAIADGLAGPLPPRPPKYPRLTNDQRTRLDAAWQEANAHCENCGLASSIAFNKKEFTSLFLHHDRKPDQTPPACRLTTTWRRELIAAIHPNLVQV